MPGLARVPGLRRALLLAGAPLLWAALSALLRRRAHRLRAPRAARRNRLVTTQWVKEMSQMGAVDAHVAPRTYGNWRKPSTAGLWGLGKISTGVLLGGLMVMIFVMMAGRLLEALVLLLLLIAGLATVRLKDRHDRSILDRTIARVGWQAAKWKGAHLYRSGPLGFALWGTHQLPGIAASLRVSEHHDSYGRAFALIQSPSTATYSVVVAAEPEGAHLVDQEQVDMWVADWGHWLANLGDEPGLQGCSVTIETAPDTGHRLRREVKAAMDPDSSPFARKMLAEVVGTYPSGSSMITAYVALTFAANNDITGKKRTAEQMGRDLASRLPGLTGDLAATGAGAASPVTASELCELVRIAYDPGASVAVQDAHALGEPLELHWSDVGPVAADAEWGGYHHDEAYSVTYAMSTAPRGQVQSGVLSRLLAPHPDVARKRVTLLYRPIDAARAAAIVEADVATAQFNATSGSRTSSRAAAATRAAKATAEEEASGAGLVNFALLVTATVTDEEKRAEARAAVDNLAGTARLRLRPVYGAQASAFAAALPLGIMLPKHVSAPSAMRSSL